MKFKPEILKRYTSMAPLALVFERFLECQIYQSLEFEHPILDVGCGEGIFSHILFDEKIDTGIDPNVRELSRAQELGAYQELIACSGASIPKLDASYQTVFSNSVLEHISDLSSVLREVNRMLADGGRFYLTVPTHLFEQYSVVSRVLRRLGFDVAAERYQVFYNRFWKQIHHYRPQEWQEILIEHGFQIIDTFTYGSKTVCTLNDALVCLSVPSYLVKKLTNRWVLFPAVKRVLLSPFMPWFEKMMAGDQRGRDGGLIYFSCIKGKEG